MEIRRHRNWLGYWLFHYVGLAGRYNPETERSNQMGHPENNGAYVRGMPVRHTPPPLVQTRPKSQPR